MADPKPVPPKPVLVSKAEAEDHARMREAIGEGLRKFYDSVAEEPIPAEWLALVGAKPDEPTA